MVGEYPSGTFRFKKIDGSFWNGETFRFADYTSAVYDTRSVQPGDTAWVEVSYDPHGQEGPFRERVRVETDSPAGCNTLFIKGTVVPSGDGGDRPSAARQEVGTAEGRD